MKEWDIERSIHTTVDRRIGKTKKAIKSALLSLMENKEVSAISITELSELANINRKTFYLHYHSIDAVFAEIEDDLIYSLKAIIEDYHFESDQSKIFALFIRMNHLINDDYEFYNHLVRLDASGSLIKKIKDILKTSVLPLVFASIDIDRRLLQFLVEFIAAGIISMYVEWFYTDKRITLEKLAEIASTFSYKCILSLDEMKLS